MSITSKIANVKKLLKDKKIAIAFSGGADSTLIAYLASQVADNPLAITINNHIMPKGFIEHTEKVCKSFNIKQIVVDIDFYKYEDIISNKHDRCFLCRKAMYEHITEIAEKEGYPIIVDGTNISDLVADRPGILINYKNNIQSPFVKSLLNSKEIHEYLDKNNIPYSKSTTCLATRLPFNNPATEENLKRIDMAESFIYENSNCEIVKVRDLNGYGVIEVDNLNDLCDEVKLKSIYDELKEIGFNKVALNLLAIDDNDEIILEEYDNGKFSYQLPYKINLKKTGKLLKNEKIKVHKNGKIEGNNFNSYNEAINEFMNILPYIRREI